MMPQDSNIKLKNKNVFVTGATGFIGGRLVEKLILEHEVGVQVLLRDYSRAALLARFDRVTMHKASLNDPVAMEDAIKNCDIVFHCAYDSKSESNNIHGIRLLTDICIKHNVSLVHLSTVSVYEPLIDGELDETKETLPCGLSYTDNKIEIEEEILQKVKKKGLQAVILQPTIVYGPYSLHWTISPVKQLLSGTVILPEEGQGLCNAVYVDDVCNAMILAATRDGVNGERFLISGSEPVTWGEFFKAYETTLGVKSISYKTGSEINQMLNNPLSLIKLLISNPKRIIQWKPVRKIAFFLRDHIPDRVKAYLTSLFNLYNKIKPQTIYMPPALLLNLYSIKSHVQIDKAKRMLGYVPKYDFNKGMELTAKYIKWAFPQSKN